MDRERDRAVARRRGEVSIGIEGGLGRKPEKATTRGHQCLRTGDRGARK